MCQELKLCVNSDCIQQTISAGKGEKHVENTKIFYFSIFKGKCFISKIKPKGYAVISFNHFFFITKSVWNLTSVDRKGNKKGLREDFIHIYENQNKVLRLK